MKLSKIYANQPDFKAISFHNGLNIIYADVNARVDSATGKEHPHNLGKTSLVELIDFMLLKKVKKGSFFYKHSSVFAAWTFYLEVELNNGKFLTIRRSVGSHPKISFKEHFTKNSNFINESDWDFENLSLNSTKAEESPIRIFEEYLSFDIIPDFGFRKTLGYFLRTQNDYRDVFRLDKFRGSDAHWKPALYALLGFDATSVEQKYKLESEKTDEKNFIAKLQVEDESEEVYKLKAAIDAKEQEKKILTSELQKFDFYKQEQSINYELVNNVETNISDLNKERYRLDYELKQIRKSLDSDRKESVDFSDVEQLFSELQVYFPDSLKKDYEAVSNFSRQISSERQKYLKQEFTSISHRLGKIHDLLVEENRKRSELLSALKERDTFVKYQEYQNDLIKLGGEIATFEAQLKNANLISVHKEALEKTKVSIGQVGTKIKDQIDKDNPDYQGIRHLFQAAFKDIMGYTALLVVQPNKENNVDFETVVLSNSQDITGKGDGFTATKTLCACFALAVLGYYSKNSFYRFAYHDGVLGDAGDNPRLNTLETARKAGSDFKIQYIISAIKNDIPDLSLLKDGEIIRTLSESDTLFGIDF